jgi:hypothetical protein
MIKYLYIATEYLHHKVEYCRIGPGRRAAVKQHAAVRYAQAMRSVANCNCDAGVLYYQA